MIILSGVLVVVAIALLIGGIVAGNSGTEVVGLDGLNLIYVSIGVSIVSALFLAIGVFLRRKDLFGSPAANATGPAARTARRGRSGKADTAAQSAMTRAGAGATTTTASGGTSVYPAGGHPSGSDPDTAEPAAMMPPPADVPADAVVYVVPGRRRYHIDSCRQLAGRSKEELTFEEAREEGFSPCTACLPDTALAARAVAGGVGTAEGTDTETAAGGESATADFDAAASEDERGAVGRTEWRGTGGSPSSVTPVQRQALDDLAEDDEPAEPDTRAHGGRSWEDADTREGASASGGRSATTQSEQTAEPAEPAEFAEPVEQAATADGPAATQPPDAAAESAAAAEHDDGSPHGADEPDDDPAEPDDEAATAADVPPQATRPTPAATTAAEPATSEATTAEAGDSSLVRILSGTKRYHRPDCALIEDIGDDADDLESLSRAEAKARGCTPCLVCQPDKEPATRD